MPIPAADIAKLQNYLQTKFGQPGIALKDRKSGDSLEVMLNGEFIGVIYRDDEDGEVSYDFNMAILDIDLDGV